MNANTFFWWLIPSLTICILLLSPVGSLAQANQSPTSSTTNKLPVSVPSEGEAYLAWYEARGEGDYKRAVNLANSYLERFPTGEGAFFIKIWLKSAGKQIKKQAAADEAGLRDLFDETVSGRASLLASLLKDLIDEETDVDIRIKDGRTGLMLAAAVGNVEYVKAFIKRHADVNAREAHGWSALTYAIWRGDAEVVQILLGAGASVNARDSGDRTALGHAKLAGDLEIIQLIEKAGGKD